MAASRLIFSPKHFLQNFVYPLYTDLFLFSDKSNWVLDWIAHYLAVNLKNNHRVRVRVVNKAWQVRDRILHFIDRYTLLYEAINHLHPSNQVILTWYHSDLEDHNPRMQQLIEKLLQASPHVAQIVTSCAITKTVLETIGIAPNQITINPIGVDLKTFTPSNNNTRSALRASLGIPDQAFCIGSFQKDGAGWGEGMEPKFVKGPDIFLEVIAEVAKHNKNLLVLLTGPARGYIKAGLQKIGVPFIHHFVKDYRDIVRYYRALDLYLITSRSEGGPVAMMESWGTGVPLVSTNMGMPADWVRHGENGLLAAVEDVDRLAENVQRFINDQELRSRCRKQALEDVKHLDWPVVTGQYYQAVYFPLISNQ